MLKFIGAVLVIISGTGIGFKASENLILQNVQLKKLKELLIILRGEIRYNNTVMSQALRNILKKSDKVFEKFLLYVADNLDKYQGKTVADIWNDGVDKELSKLMLSKKHIEKLKDLGNTLGFLDKEMQISYFNLMIEQLDTDIEDNNKRCRDNCKLYRTLGIMGGILVVLIIV